VPALAALDSTGIAELVVAGGVGANSRLRQRLSEEAGVHGFAVHYPELQFCTDNGAMIAFAGYLRLAAGEHAPLRIDTRARWPLDELKSLIP
jgi:N6-L-threonylcarbamoyladenine synthase